MPSNDRDKYMNFTILGLHFFIDLHRYFKIAVKVWITLLAILMISMLGFNYEMMSADLPGGFLAGGLLAYLIHMLVDQ